MPFAREHSWSSNCTLSQNDLDRCELKKRWNVTNYTNMQTYS